MCVAMRERERESEKESECVCVREMNGGHPLSSGDWWCKHLDAINHYLLVWPVRAEPVKKSK